MNVYQELIFSYLEEDNTQRAYFRVKPLLATSGDIRQEAQAAWADEGALRIVPDRAEQYHFKDRMRTLGSYCVMDLTHTTEEANKIRTNKNYNPAKGERNQYILFSDAVQPLPNHSFFHVLDGTAEQASELAKQAITPLFYLRDGDTLYGPVNRDQVKEVTPAAPARARCIPWSVPMGLPAHFSVCRRPLLPVKWPPMLRRRKNRWPSAVNCTFWMKAKTLTRSFPTLRSP